jgi:hypothetical protein
MTTIIMNIGRVPLQVGVIKQVKGKPVSTSVRVPGRGRTPMPTDCTIDNNWMALYGKNIKLVDSATVQAPAVPVAKTSKSNVAGRMAAQKVIGSPVKPATATPAVTKATPTAPTVSSPAVKT